MFSNAGRERCEPRNYITRREDDWCELKANWSVAVIYDEPKARETAMTFCDCLVQKFWAESEFDVSWWSVSGLEQTSAAEEALKRSVGADVVVFAIQEQMPTHFHQWANEWLNRRGTREGALVGLITAGDRPSGETVLIEGFLRHLAHCAGMDFLTEVPQAISLRIPESLESCAERAHQVTTVLDGILHQPGSPRSPK
jgi:hypothetical protein